MANNVQTRLNKVKDAIDAIMDGGAVQSYTINGKRLDKCSLTELMALEKYLQAQSDAQTDTTAYAQFEDPV